MFFSEGQKGLLDLARKQRGWNAAAKVSGKRFALPLAGRTIEIVYYKADDLMREAVHTARFHGSETFQSSPDFGRKRPLIIGLHGGGALMGGGALNDAMWADAARTLEADVVSVDYRLTPNHHYPDPVMDAVDVTAWLREHHEDFGFDPERIVLMGFSSGGNIAAAAALLESGRAERLYRAEILVYPYLDMVTDPLDKGANPEEKEMFDLFNELYVTPEQAKNPLASPLYAGAKELGRLPETILVTAGRDILRHEGEAYAGKLRQAGVRVWEMQAQNMLHAYFEDAYRPDEELTSGCGEEVRKLFRNGSLQGAARETLKFIRDSAVLR